MAVAKGDDARAVVAADEAGIANFGLAEGSGGLYGYAGGQDSAGRGIFEAYFEPNVHREATKSLVHVVYDSSATLPEYLHVDFEKIEPTIYSLPPREHLAIEF